MSGLYGTPGERWPLSRAVDAMAEAARRAGAPGLIWAVGFAYPQVLLSLEVVHATVGLLPVSSDANLPRAGHIVSALLTEGLGWAWPGAASESVWAFLVFLPITLLVCRLITGLAYVSEPASWERLRGKRRSPSILTAWRCGKGQGFATLGVLLSMPFLLFVATLFLIGPVAFLREALPGTSPVPTVTRLFLAPIVLLLYGYGMLLLVLVQLAIHSLARNRRGAASALTHAWRLVRNSPWACVRAALVNLLLEAAAFLALILAEVRMPFQWAMVIAAFLFLGFSGVARAIFWGQAYQDLGGMTTVEDLPAKPSGKEQASPA